jgi:hypothetical protein
MSERRRPLDGRDALAEMMAADWDPTPGEAGQTAAPRPTQQPDPPRWRPPPPPWAVNALDEPSSTSNLVDDIGKPRRE